MLKRLPASRARELVAAASEFPTSDPAVSYPSWYLHRWHFLPEGYLSRRSAAGYDKVIRHVYNQGLEAGTIRAVVDRVERLAADSVLEVGCGPGRLLTAMAKRGVARDLVGIDLSPHLLERAGKRLGGKQARVVHANGLAIPADDGSFDVAVASHYIGHLPPLLRSAAVLEMARVVRPGGHIVVVDHLWHPWPAISHLRLEERDGRAPGFVQVRTYQRVEASLK